MPTYSFEARDQEGKPQNGVSDAVSMDALLEELRSRNLFVLNISEATKALDFKTITQIDLFAWMPPSAMDIELSLNQLSLMLRSGLSLVNAIHAIIENTEKSSLKRIWTDVVNSIEEGLTLAEAMKKHKCFPTIAIHLVGVGEQTGNLDGVLERAVVTLTSNRHLRSTILTAMMYPLLITLVAIFVTIFLMLFLIPKLEQVLVSTGKPMPELTQKMLDTSHFLQLNMPLILSVVGCALVGFIMLRKWPPGRLFTDHWALRLPLMGTIFRLSSSTAFAHSLAILVKSGVSLIESLVSMEALLSNRWVSRRVGIAREQVIAGDSLADNLRDPVSFTKLLPQMVAVGETSGSLDQVLEEVSKFHESQLQTMVKRLSVIVEPVIMIVVGSMVAVVYLSFFMAIMAASTGA